MTEPVQTPEAAEATPTTPEATESAQAAPAAPKEPAKKAGMTQEEVDRLVQLDRENWQARQEIQKMQAELKTAREFQDRFKADPYAVAQEHGLDLDTYTQRVLNDGEPTPGEQIAALRQELSELKGFKQELMTKEQQAEEARHWTGMASDVEAYVAQNADQFGAIDQIKSLNKELGGGFDLPAFVQTRVRAHHEKTGKVLTPAEVSGILLDEAMKQVEAFTASPTLRAIMAEVIKAEQGQPQEPDSPAQPQRRPSVTNGLESGSEQVDLESLPHQKRIMAVANKYSNVD